MLLTLVRVNHSHLTQPSMIVVSHCPLATARIAADGNSFFQIISIAISKITGGHSKLRLLISTYMIQRSTDPMLSSHGSQIHAALWKATCMHETIKDADSGALGLGIGGHCTSIIA